MKKLLFIPFTIAWGIVIGQTNTKLKSADSTNSSKCTVHSFSLELAKINKASTARNTKNTFKLLTGYSQLFGKLDHSYDPWEPE